MTSAVARMIANLYVFALILNFILAFGFAAYGAVSGTGPSGYVMAWQFDVFGRASQLATMAVVTAFLMIPSPLLGLLVSKLSPEVRLALREKLIGNPHATQQQRQASAELSWRVIFGVTAGILLVTAVVSGTLYIMNRQDQAAGIYDIDLDRSSASLPDGVAYAKVRGHLAHSFAAGFKQRSSRSKDGSTHVFAPLTEANWSKDMPVRYFVHHEQYGLGGSASLPAAFEASGSTLFAGSVSEQLPVFVARDYAGKGLKIAPSYRVINLEPLPEGGAPMGYSHLVALGIGAFASIISLGGLAGGKLLTRRIVKRT